MFMKKPKHRIFDYEPRFYDPTKDEREKLKRRMGFARYRKSIGKRHSPIKIVLIILVVLLGYLKLTGIM